MAPAGRHKKIAELVFQGDFPAEIAEDGLPFVDHYLDRVIGVRKRLCEAVNWWFTGSFLLKCACNPVPDDQDHPHIFI